MAILHATTPVLDIAYEAAGPTDGRSVVLLHGWPDDVRTWDAVAPALHAAGFRTYAPWLRGFGPTRFLSADTQRSAEIGAMAQDILDFLDALNIGRVSVVGHDWGARIAYFLACVAPERLERIVTISVPWSPGPLPTPSLEQVQRFWYQWFMATERGAAFVRANGKAFARRQWDTWGPTGWFDDATYDVTARSFENPDWPAITLHGYRVRWEEAEPDPRHAELNRRQRAVTAIGTPTLLIHGGDDRCVMPASSAGLERNFTGVYERHVLDGIGHFPPRESPDAVAKLITAFFSHS